MVADGDFKYNIISYAYPDVLVSWYANHSIGSTYFLAHPGEAGFVKWLDNHGIKSYTGKELIDEDGNFIPDFLFDETLFVDPEKSTLTLKNSGMKVGDDFHVSLVMKKTVDS